ncbi:AMP-binding protein [Enterovibrio paralichthyis]|uniref:AMP-binding protein n=1 Tax=Enterovibrio paralichthyis TaxID=2853805 RepID=UPI001C485F0D|nr:AMP-binding protein [Enterovibrio paralichthyis]MBV7296412.1 AMP-binding protein [Enterovibrio paralichthyis]
MVNLLEKLKNHATQQPDKTALIGREANGEQVTVSYAELWRDVQVLGDVLRGWEASCLALMAENGIAWAKVDLAALLAGVTVIPVPTFFSAVQIEHLLETAHVDVLVGNWQHLRGAPDTGLAGLPCYFNAFEKSADSGGFCSDALAKITFTSGSTGAPKGVKLSAGLIDAVTQSLADAVSQENRPERHLVALPLSTLLENITGIYVPLYLGLETVVVEGYEIGLRGSSSFSAEQFAHAMVRYQPESLVITPMFLMALVSLGTQNPETVASLKFIAVGGAKVPAALLTRAEQLGLPVYEGYGLSECGSVVSFNSPKSRRAGSVGKPLPHCGISLSSEGEILVSGATMLGYIGEEPQGDKAIGTGDLGRFDKDGYLYVTGRKKNLLITAFGRNVSPEWIEAEAMAFPHLHQMVVMGDGCAVLSAVVSTNNQPLALAEIAQLNALLPDYAAIGHVVFTSPFHLQSGLLTPNGRPKRTRFADQFSKHIPANSRIYSQRKSITFSVDSAATATAQG